MHVQAGGLPKSHLRVELLSCMGAPLWGVKLEQNGINVITRYSCVMLQMARILRLWPDDDKEQGD